MDLLVGVFSTVKSGEFRAVREIDSSGWIRSTTCKVKLKKGEVWCEEIHLRPAYAGAKAVVASRDQVGAPDGRAFVVAQGSAKRRGAGPDADLDVVEILAGRPGAQKVDFAGMNAFPLGAGVEVRHVKANDVSELSSIIERLLRAQPQGSRSSETLSNVTHVSAGSSKSSAGRNVSDHDVQETKTAQARRTDEHFALVTLTR